MQKKILAILCLIMFLSIQAPRTEAIGVTCTPGIFDVRLNKLGRASTFSITVGNLDLENERHIKVYLVTPFDFKPRYHEMPNPESMITFNTSRILVGPNGAEKLSITINIPDQQENYGKRWEVWIAVEAEQLPGEILKTKVFSRMLVQTPDALQVNIGVSAPSMLIFLIGGMCIAGVFIWYRIYSMRKDMTKKINNISPKHKVKNSNNDDIKIVRRGDRGS